MKIFYLGIIVSLLMVGLFSCKKDTVNKQPNNDSEMMIQSKKVVALIKQFDLKMENTLKSDETITLDSAIWNIEASLNYNYADPEEAVGEYSYSKSNYLLEVDANGGVSMGDAQTVYAQMEQDLGNNFKSGDETVIIFSDVALDSITGGAAYLSGTNGYSSGVVGSSSPFGEGDDWIWGTVIGTLAGKCDGSMVGVSDGSNELEWHLNNPIGAPTPPFYTDIETVEVNYELCKYNEPPELPRIFNSLDGDYCMEYTEMNYFFAEANIIIYDYNDPTNDGGGGEINVYDEEGARPAGKDFISISTLDDFNYYDSKWFHWYYITYGVANIAPTD